MIFYSFYTDKYKATDSLVYRTETGHSPMQIDLKFFPAKPEAEKDFFQLLWDNPDYRIGEYFDTEKQKKVKHEADRNITYDKLPEDFALQMDKVYNLDCELFMQQVPNKFVDYIFTSPPYNAGKRTSFGERNAIYKDDEDMYDYFEDTMDEKEYQEWITRVITESLRITKKHVFFNIQMLGNNKKTVFNIFKTFDKKIKDIIIWNKQIASPHINKKIMNSAFEFIFIFSNVDPEKRYFEDSHFGGKFRNVITGMNASMNKYRTFNKATFPLYLPRKVMQNFGKPGDLWCDPFSGTGTTFHAAILENRHFIGSELDSVQCEVTNQRVFQEESVLKLDLNEDLNME